MDKKIRDIIKFVRALQGTGRYKKGGNYVMALDKAENSKSGFKNNEKQGI